MSLSASAQKVQDVLGPAYTVIESEVPTKTAQQAADLVGCQLGQIVKSLIFQGQETGKAILVLTSGANRVDESLIAAYAGEPIGRANPDFVREVTGFAIGGVPPVGHAQKVETYIDQDLLSYDEIWAAAGTPNSLFKLTPSDLQKLTNGTKANIKFMRYDE